MFEDSHNDLINRYLKLDEEFRKFKESIKRERYFKITFETYTVIQNIHQPITTIAVVTAKNPIDAMRKLKKEMEGKEILTQDIIDMGEYAE